MSRPPINVVARSEFRGLLLLEVALVTSPVGFPKSVCTPLSFVASQVRQIAAVAVLFRNG